MTGHLPHTAEQKQQTLSAPKVSPFSRDSETFAHKPQHFSGSGSSREQHAIGTESTAGGRSKGVPGEGF